MKLSHPSADNPRSTRSTPLTELKDILIFLDGTGKDGALDSGNSHPTTNVWQLYLMAESIGSGHLKRKRISLYIPGVGSGKGDLKIKRWLIQIYGSRIVDQVVQAWNYIYINYRPGDRIYLFGYSRGAFAARKLASLLLRLELSNTGRSFLEKWRLCERPLSWIPPEEPPKTPIAVECIGVWDTVGAVYNPVFRLKQNLIGTPDDEFPSNVKHVFHALAFHENRMRFQVNLFESPKGRTPPKQIWFPGSHSDVGGGGKNPDLPRISLLWLLGELQPHITIRNSQILYPEVNHLKPSDAYSESGWKRLVDRYETRLDSKALKARDLIHISLTEIDKANIRPRRAAYHSLMNILELDYLGLQTVALNQVERELSRTRLRTTSQVIIGKIKNQLRDPLGSLASTGMQRNRSNSSTGVIIRSPRPRVIQHPEWRHAIYADTSSGL